jgi:hypothetical protein
MDSEQQPCGPKAGQPIDRKEDRSSQRRISLEVGVVGTDIREDSGGRHSVFLVEVNLAGNRTFVCIMSCREGGRERKHD